MNKKSYFKILLSFFLLFGFYAVVKAADSGIPLQVPLPGQGNTVKDLSSYISSWYTFGISAISIIAVVMIMWSGMQWITAAGNATQIGEAKRKLSDAVVGLILALCAYGLLYLINPALVELKLPSITPIKKTPIDIVTGRETEMTKKKCSSDADCFANETGVIVYDYICLRYNCSNTSEEIPPENRTCIYKQTWQKCAQISPVCAIYDQKCQTVNIADVRGNCCDSRLVCNTQKNTNATGPSNGNCKKLGKEGDSCGRDVECEAGLSCSSTWRCAK